MSPLRRSVNEPDLVRRHLLRTDLTLIHAHSSLLIRRHRNGVPLEPDDVCQRLERIVEAVERLDRLTT